MTRHQLSKINSIVEKVEQIKTFFAKSKEDSEWFLAKDLDNYKLSYQRNHALMFPSSYDFYAKNISVLNDYRQQGIQIDKSVLEPALIVYLETLKKELLDLGVEEEL